MLQWMWLMCELNWKENYGKTKRGKLSINWIECICHFKEWRRKKNRLLLNCFFFCSSDECQLTKCWFSFLDSKFTNIHNTQITLRQMKCVANGDIRSVCDFILNMFAGIAWPKSTRITKPRILWSILAFFRFLFMNEIK